MQWRAAAGQARLAVAAAQAASRSNARTAS